MSASPPKADIRQRIEHVCFVPIVLIRFSSQRLAPDQSGIPRPLRVHKRTSAIPSYRWRSSRHHAHHGRVADNARPVPPNESPESLLSGLPTQTGLRLGTGSFARCQTLYQSELKTLAAPTLVVLHFPVHAFHAEKSFQLALACSK